MDRPRASAPPRFRAYGRQHLHRLPQLSDLNSDQRVALEAVSAVLPFRVNPYVLEELVDWTNIPEDPIYQLTFPQAGMLESSDFERLADAIVRQDQDGLRRLVPSVQRRMNPHPSGQLHLNVPSVDGAPFPGAQHKYRETMLFFPSQGQTCHAYCTYCFRWAQFVGIQELKIANHEAPTLHRYVESHPELTDILFTGGDPLIMSAKLLSNYIDPLLTDGAEHISSIRLGTKSLAYWPYRFLSDPDADDILRLFERVRRSGRQLALMAHFSHPRELETTAVERAMRRILDAGAVIRCQAPLIRHVNADPAIWADMWSREVRLGAVPYYMFVERDTGPRHYFEVPLAEAFAIFTAAYGQVSGLARTVRGPSMSAAPGKVLVDGVAEIAGEEVFVLKLIQGRDQAWVNRVFFARHDSRAAWLDDLKPACGEREFFFERPIQLMAEGRWAPAWMKAAGDRELASA